MPFLAERSVVSRLPLDVTSMRWLRFAGRPISNVLRGLVSR